MLHRMTRALPALVACLLLCLLPACGSVPMAAAQSSGVPADRIVYLTEADGSVRAVPASSVGLHGVSREASGHDPLAGVHDGEVWAYVVLFAFYLVYYIGYSFYLLGELMWEHCSEQGEEKESAEPECPAATPAAPVR